VTDFVIQHQCPQCGAPAELSETDRLLACGFCRVRSYLTIRGVPRYVIPHHAPQGKEVFYYPYWRFKGMLFSCMSRRIENRFLDVSHQALLSHHFPPNIGFRAQTQKLRFAAGEAEGRFLKPGVSFDDIFAKLREQYAPSAGPLLHQEFIGETRSLIYSPFYFDSKLLDAVVNTPVSNVRREQMPEGMLQSDDRHRPIGFLAALCPNCGGDLEGDSDCLVMTCRGCKRAWWEQKGRLVPLKTSHFSGNGDRLVYLPFWRIQADVAPVRLETYADLVKIANLPRAVQPGWDKIPFRFWNPAFKLRPQSYLTIATQVTLGQPMEKAVSGPPGGTAHGVTLPIQEALESLKLNIANFLRPLEARMEIMPQLEIKPHRFSLVYIPFKDTRLELVQPRLNLAVNKSVLSHARNL
jgi:ribosomal protein S27AE